MTGLERQLPLDRHARDLNLANWNERVGVHLGDGGYDLSTHRAGKGELDAIVAGEIGDVAGLRILHLQCHIGHDSIALAQRGASMVGVDFSGAAIEAAQRLAQECGVETATFVESDVYEAPDVLSADLGGFDLVFTTWGAVCWLPDLLHWARVIRQFLRPGGAFYFAETHPVALVFDDISGDADADGRPIWLVPYFEREPQIFDEPTDYAHRGVKLTHSRSVQWMHPLADILAALKAADMDLDFLREHDRIPYQMFPSLVRDRDGLWTWPRQPWLPLALSLRAIAR